MNLKRILEQNGIDSTSLDSLVDDAASRAASRVNNEGMREQLDYLEQQGVSPEAILDEVGVDAHTS